MSAKFIYTLSDDKPDLQKQIGCMNGIFQLFDRRHFLNGGRRIGGPNRKSLPPGHNSSPVMELKREFQKSTEKNQKVVKEKRRTSTESTRSSSSSSSCSSSLSCLECSKQSQLEPPTVRQSIAQETHVLSSPTCKSNAPFQTSQESLDLRDVVKDSFYREARGLSVKTASRGSTGGQTLKYIDSPRPFEHFKPVDSKASGLKESFQVHHKLQVSSYKPNAAKHGSSTSSLRDARRFSCDGRESRDTFKSTIKLKELPRLSLDSRSGSMRGLKTEMKSNHTLHNSTRENQNSQQQEVGSYGKPCSVVAKLMGLENLPELASTKGNEIITDTENDPFSVSSRILDHNKQYLITGSPRNSQQESLSIRHKNAESDKKSASSLKFPIEPAPWKRIDESRRCPTPTLKTGVSLPKTPKSPFSVYGEMENMLAHLEFKKSGKDLRALKQILEAMQKTKEMLESRNEASSPLSHSSSNSSLNQHSKTTILQNLPNRCSNSASTNGMNSPKGSKSPIVIMKPTKFVEKASPPTAPMNATNNLSGPTKGVVKNPSANSLGERSSQAFKTSNKKNGARLIRLAQNSNDPQPNTRMSIKQGKGSASMNLRPHQKKLGLEKQLCPKMPASDLNRTRRQPIRQLIESPDRKSNRKTIDEGYSAICGNGRDLSFQGDSVSMQSESTVSLASLVDDEVSSIDRADKTSYAPNEKAQRTQKNHVARSHTKPVITSSEQPSPVSILDAALCLDELPSPIKKISTAFKAEDEAVNSAELQWNPVDVNHSSSIAKFTLNPLLDPIEAEDTNSISHHLKQTLFMLEENIPDEVTAFYASSNPVHRYISEIVLASGLLRDFESQFTTSLNPTGYPINHNLFLALEEASGRTRHSNGSSDKQSDSEPQVKIQRKLVFDFVNEILPQKLQVSRSPNCCLSSNIPAGQGQRGYQLLGELCSEIDGLQSANANYSLDDEEDSLANIIWADLKHESTHWTAFPDEIPGLVLDVERLIFKDLVNEVVVVDVRGRSTGHCRQLFSK
ncbi:hypothetical protein K2173_020150 [Erythroxylum novogranatense]|uniref:DUF4378 domain-containing protein n=1 Tax=Erythroxylum novogranatense TaxID=1862640 RepID=A0AAV8U776_9ROSI|nr:hypothetical protein K2173_020150 [Erythroxylum novogranatense]